ncbi:NAD(P)-dependent oxidoreductase [Chloroflexota bacterium]
MAKAKVVFIQRVEPELQEMFVAEAPSDFQIVTLDPNVGEEEITAQVKDADFLLLSRSGRIAEQVLLKAKKLKLIQVTGQGTEHIPKHLAWQLGIFVANSGGANALAVAEHTILLMLAVMRNLLPSVEILRQGKFQSDMDRRTFHQLYEKTVGIVGFGSIGRRVAKLVYDFGAHVIFFDEVDIPNSIIADFRACRVDLEELLRSADVVTLHVPLVESTKGMIGWEQITKMRPSAILINASRGPVVDEAALVRALREKKIAGAGIDVFEQEPPSPENPLLHMDNVVATPHMAASAWEEWVPRVKSIWDNFLRVWQGKEPHNTVTS